MATRKQIPLIPTDATLTIGAGKTLSTSVNLDVSGNDVSIVGSGTAVITFPTVTSTLATIADLASKADSGANTDITSILLNQTGLVVKGATSFALTIKPNETLTAARTLNIITGDATRSLTFTADTIIGGTHSGTSSGSNTGDQTISITGDVTASGSTGALSAIVTKINGTLLSGLTTGILKNTTTTGIPTIAVAGTDYLVPFSSQKAKYFYAAPNASAGTPSFRAIVASDIPTLNQNTTGSAATLKTPRAINGVNFNGSAAITVTAAATTLTGTALNSTVVTSSLTSLGTITSGGLSTGAVIGGVTMTLGSDASYDIYYRNGSGILTRLGGGTDGYVLTTHSTTSAPTWTAPYTLAIGSSIGSATAKSILYAGSGGVLAQDNANFNYDSSTKILTAQGLYVGNTNGGFYSESLLSGSYNISIEQWTFTGGESSETDGRSSMAYGVGTVAASYGETALGLYNDFVSATSTTTYSATDAVFSVGNGVDAFTRSNAILILKNGKTYLPILKTSLTSPTTTGTTKTMVVDSNGLLSSITTASGTVTSITAGTGLSGGTITTSGTINLANTAVTPASYTLANVTIDAQGRITAASNGTVSFTGLIETSSGQDEGTGIAAKTYVIELYAAYGYTINTLKIISGAGTCTAALKINSTAVTGISSVSVSTSIATGTASAANTVVTGDKIELVITSPSGLGNLSWTIKTTRT